MTNTLTRDEVVKVAVLARLKLTDGQIDALTSELAKILEYVQVLDELDTESIEPMAHAVTLSDVFREDEVRPSLPRTAALANAPKTDGRYFLVPAILGDN